MTKYRKLPVVIDAVQWDGTKSSWDAIMAMGLADWSPGWSHGPMGSESLIIKTLEGDHLASKGDFIIKGVHGEFYPCKPEIFAKTYELCDGQADRAEEDR